jgi:hypothetical protein
MTTLNLMGTRFEAPDPDPVQRPQQQVETKPQAPPAKDERYEVLERELAEVRRSNQQLVDLVGRQTPARQAEQNAALGDDVDIDWGQDEDDADETDEPEDPATLVEDLSKLGRDALAKRGFLRKADVVKMVREESRKAAKTAATQVVKHARTEVTRESVVIREFPDLANPESDLFKATAAHVRNAVRLDPNAAKNPTTLYLAAQAAKAELGAKSARGARPQDGDRQQNRPGPLNDDFELEEDDEDREPVLRERPSRSERDIRIASQQGDRGRGGRSKVQGDDDDFVMDADARNVAAQMGITADEFKTEATRVRKAAGQTAGRRR